MTARGLQVSKNTSKPSMLRKHENALGSKVLKLVRTAIGPIQFGSLQIGKWRELTEAERVVLMKRDTRFSPLP